MSMLMAGSSVIGGVDDLIEASIYRERDRKKTMNKNKIITYIQFHFQFIGQYFETCVQPSGAVYLMGSVGWSARSATLAVYLFRLSVCLSDLLYFCTIFQLISYKEFHIHMLIYVHIYTYMCL